MPDTHGTHQRHARCDCTRPKTSDSDICCNRRAALSHGFGRPPCSRIASVQLSPSLPSRIIYSPPSPGGGCQHLDSDMMTNDMTGSWAPSASSTGLIPQTLGNRFCCPVLLPTTRGEHLIADGQPADTQLRDEAPLGIRPTRSAPRSTHSRFSSVQSPDSEAVGSWPYTPVFHVKHTSSPTRLQNNRVLVLSLD